ncbi:hypothetical protein [Nostoc sp.]|uniref:hypothetical protein n=1 Tax=Nostoc sp. TaxID=1180 RepID=UPI002FFB018B
MDIGNLSFLTALTDEDASKVNGGYIDYESFANSTFDSYATIGNFLDNVGLDGSSWYAAGLNFLTL